MKGYTKEEKFELIKKTIPHLENGDIRGIAAQKCGFSGSALSYWLKDFPEMLLLVERAEFIAKVKKANKKNKEGKELKKEKIMLKIPEDLKNFLISLAANFFGILFVYITWFCCLSDILTK